MDNIVRNIKDKLTANNLVDMMKEAKVIDEETIKEQEVRKALSNIDPNADLTMEDMASRLNDMSNSKPKPSKSKTQDVVDAAKSSLGVLQKFTKSEEKPKEKRKEDEPHPYMKDDNIFNLYDDFR